MASSKTSLAEIDIYTFFRNEVPTGINSVIQGVEDCFSRGTLGLWKPLGNAAYLGPRVVRHSFDSLGTLSGDSRKLCEELRAIRLSLREFETDHAVEFVLLPKMTRSCPPRIAVFDMDSTLIQAEVIDELARGIGKMEEVAAITDMAMNGQVDFAESLKLRVELLRGVPTTIWDELKLRIKFMPGARELTRALGKLGVKMAVFSGGFREMAIWVGSELGLHQAAANLVSLPWRLERLCAHKFMPGSHQYTDHFKLVSSGPTTDFPYPHLTGQLDPQAFIVTADRKRRLLEAFARENDVPLNQTICVGDGANDLEMMTACGSSGGIAIAFRAKVTVQQTAPNRLNNASLTDILYLTGLPAAEIEALVQENGTGTPETRPIPTLMELVDEV